MKKSRLSLVLALSLVAGLSVTAFASSNEPDEISSTATGWASGTTSFTNVTANQVITIDMDHTQWVEDTASASPLSDWTGTWTAKALGVTAVETTSSQHVAGVAVTGAGTTNPQVVITMAATVPTDGSTEVLSIDLTAGNTATESISVTYTTEYAVAVTASPAAGGSPIASPNPATQNATVTLTANPAIGYRFDRWESASPGVVIASPTDPTTTFVMPGNDAVVVARYTGGNRSSRSSSSDGTYAAPAKTLLPASAFSWEGIDTLTINHESVTPFGLLSVQWDGVETTAYSKYSGSVIVRFDADFIAAQAPGEHTIRVEFLNHTGETTVTVGQTAATDEPAGHPDNETDNPNTGDGRVVWPALLLGSLGAAGLVAFQGKRRLL